MSQRRCRRSCAAMVPSHRAFCPACWRTIPRRVQRAVYDSYDGGRYRDGILAHMDLLEEVEAALEGERPWGSVAP